ncbi:hypothetical protein [Sphaerimonospora thailandensis]|uniref:Concanavalin A-like lectin/glucanase superfamily protein n=1 Tax=Sphaerimonospora thailandensis TaxID=795644 RepID=A0A8J3VYH3_9ACTN|nr:hypothetical protein [Sphaerimonospora thailandensis]GIH69437.1 hypothetical protein Mth01_16900 [Sphaerimonospora thailandensis]
MAFPADPLDVRTDLYLDGAWVDITDDVRVSSGLSIRRGQSDEGSRSDPAKCTLTIDNRDGKYSPRNPASPYYGRIGRNTPIRVSVARLGMALNLTGEEKVAATTPAVPALDLTGDLDIRCLVELSRWSSANAQTFIGKHLGAYVFGKDESDRLRLEWTSGGVYRAARSTPVTFADGSAQWVRVTYDRDNGAGGHTTTFYTSADGVTWTQFGDPATGSGTEAVNTNSTPLALGVRGDVASAMAGRIYRAEVRDGIGGTVVAAPDFRALAEGTTSFTDSAGRTWTVTPPAAEVTAKDVRFVGEASAWPPRWDVAGADVTVPIEAAGILRRLGQGASPLKSTMYRGLTSPGLTTDVVAYWSCEDAAGATSLASAVGGSPMRVKGSPDLAAYTGFACSEPIPVLKGSEWSGTIPAYTVTGQTQLRFLLAVPSGGEASDSSGRTVFRWRTSGSASRWEVVLSSFGGLALRAYSGENAQVLNTDYVTFAANGKLLRVSAELTQNGPNVSYAISALVVGQTTGGTWTGTLNGHTVGAVAGVTVAPGGGLGDTALGHVVMQTAVTSLYDLASQLNAWDGEQAGQRIRRLCDEEGIPIVVIGGWSDTAMAGPQRPATLLDLLTEAAAADMGILTEPRDRLGLLYRTRKTLYGQRPAVALDYAAGHLVPPLEPVDDDQATRNDVTVKREGGSSARAVRESGPLSVAAPPAGVGRYGEEVTVGVQSDALLPDQAGWRLHLGTVDEARYPSITVDLTAEALRADQALASAMCRLDAGDRITVDNLPSWLPPGQVSQIARGLAERLGPFDWDITVACSPESPWRVARYGTARYGLAGSTLAAGVTSAAATLSVSVPDGLIWTTDPAEFPFDIVIGGEVMTVTSITGTGPQTFTVIRAANGVTKAHSSGAAVVLAEPGIRAL